MLENKVLYTPSDKPQKIQETQIILKNSDVLNNFSRLNHKRVEMKNNLITGKSSISFENNNLTIEFNNSNTIDATTTMLFDIIQHIHNERNTDSVILTIDEYMTLKDLKISPSNKKKHIKTIKDHLHILEGVSLSFIDNSKKKPSRIGGMNFIDSWFYKNGAFKITLTKSFIAYYDALMLLLLPKELFKIDTNKNRYAYYISRKIYEIKRMQHGKILKKAESKRTKYEKDKLKNNYIIVGVNTLYKDSNLPKYEDIKNRTYKQQIIDPFERDLNKIEEENLITWEYCNQKGKVLLEDELEKIYNWDKWVDKFLKIYFLN